MANEEPAVIELISFIDRNNTLQLMYYDVAHNNNKVIWLPGSGLGDLLPLRGNAASIALVVKDFYGYGSLYTMYGAVIAADGTVLAYWDAVPQGQRYTLAVPSNDIPNPMLIIGATPRTPGAPVPAVFRSWGSGNDGLPTDSSTPIGQRF